MDPTTMEKSREKVREFLKANGKDPEKLMPVEDPNSETQAAESASSAGKEEGVEDREKEQQEQASRAAQAKKAEEAQALEANKAEEKRLIDGKDEELSEEDRSKKKELLLIKETEREAQKEAKLQKRFDDLTGQIKALRAEKDQDKGKIEELVSELDQLKGSVKNDPKKIQEEAKRIESERISKMEAEDIELPREERREMSKNELEEWLVEDMVAAQEWLAERQMRRRDERLKDLEQLKKPSAEENKQRAEAVIRQQAESQKRVSEKHPELDTVAKRLAELKEEGKTKDEAVKILFKENPKVKIVADIMREEPDKYLLSGNGPELLAEEMERRLNASSSNESAEDREARIASEAAEAERQRQANIDPGLKSTRNGDKGSQSSDKDPVYQKQLGIWKKAFPHETEAQIKARLDKRLKARREVGAA